VSPYLEYLELHFVAEIDLDFVMWVDGASVQVTGGSGHILSKYVQGRALRVEPSNLRFATQHAVATFELMTTDLSKLGEQGPAVRSIPS
jgi:hypothetical protein